MFGKAPACAGAFLFAPSIGNRNYSVWLNGSDQVFDFSDVVARAPALQ